MATESPKTLFIDIDGVIFKHYESGQSAQIDDVPILLPGVLVKLNEWERAGHRIVLCTGRREGTRAATEWQLKAMNIPYDQLVMGCTRGQRVVINDGDGRAAAVCIGRNDGLERVKI